MLVSAAGVGRRLPNLDVEGHAPPPEHADEEVEEQERVREPVPTGGE